VVNKKDELVRRMGFAIVLKGVVIAFIGGILALLGLGIIAFPTLL
jgi:hypothetical protein